MENKITRLSISWIIGILLVTGGIAHSKSMEAEVTIRKLSEILVEMDVDIIVYSVCDEHTYFLNPVAQRKQFPDKHYILPSDSKLYSELVDYAAIARKEYCEYKYSNFIEVALNRLLDNEVLYKVYFPPIHRIVNGNPKPGDQGTVFQALDRSINEYLFEKRRPVVERYNAKVKEIYDRYWDCESC
jgi:hypothetical protein